MGSSDRSEQQTELTLSVNGRLAAYPCAFEAVIGGAGGLEFTGHIDIDAPLGEFLASLYRHFEGTPDDRPTPFDTGIFPDFRVPSPTIAYLSETATFLIRLDTTIPLPEGAPLKELDLAFAFATVGGETASEGETAPAGEAAKRRYVTGIRSKTPIGLAAIGESGIIGKLLGDVGISRIGIYYASDDIAEFPLFDAGKPEKQGFAGGISFSARFGAGNSFADIALPPPPAPAASPASRSWRRRSSAETGGGREAIAAPAGKPAAGAEDARLRKWFKVQKTFGPLEVRRIGGEWHEGKLGFLFDAGVELMGLKVGLAGLRVSVEPGKLTTLKPDDLEIGLDGLEIDFKAGPVGIGGAFLKTPDGAYSGMARISAQVFTITAIGSYSTTKKGDPSLFIFGAYVGIIGGPPAFVVQGVAAGFGYNRGLTIPDIEDVRDFPLVSMVLGPAPGGSTSMLDQLGGNHFPTMQGQYWLAAGIKFTSFKLVDAFALVTVQFGARFELALLGVASMQQPPKVDGASGLPKPFVFVELALKVRFAPDDGVLAVQAVLTSNSYLFDTRCKLTGGFAFFIWFPPTNPAFEDHSGDFVITFGGYHPRFKVPAHYPEVPRIGFNWQMPAQGVTVKGECYFALTPSCIMGGCRLSAIYKSGDFAAWFEAYADFLMAWEPFHYEADIGVWIGASYTFRLGAISSTLSVHLGASLSIWGPEFAGEARVDLGIVAFTVEIGAANVPRTPPPIEWSQFRGKFIPHVDEKPAPLSIAITGGVLREDKDAKLFVVNPCELSIVVDAYIPATALRIGDEALTAGDQPFETAFGIRPLAARSMTSEIDVWFRDAGGNSFPMRSLAVTKGVPEALWSPRPAPDAKGNRAIESKVMKNALSGTKLFVHEMRPASEATASPTIEPVSKRTAKPDAYPLVHAKPYDTKTARDRLRKALVDNAGVRDQAVSALRSLGFDLSPETIDLERMARCAAQADVLLAPPLFVPLGELPPLRHEQ